MEKRPTVLVAEDFPATFNLLRTVLERAGMRVIGAGTASQAVERAAAENPDLILMDVQLASGDGLAAAREIRAASATQEIPIIALSGGLLPRQLREQSRAAGCDDYLAKPFRMADLAWRIHRWMRPASGE